MDLVNQHGFGSVAFPIIGAGTGGFAQEDALQLMIEAFGKVKSQAAVTVVRYRR